MSSTDQNENVQESTPVPRFGYVGRLRAKFYPKPKFIFGGTHISNPKDFMLQKVYAETGLGYWTAPSLQA